MRSTGAFSQCLCLLARVAGGRRTTCGHSSCELVPAPLKISSGRGASRTRIGPSARRIGPSGWSALCLGSGHRNDEGHHARTRRNDRRRPDGFTRHRCGRRVGIDETQGHPSPGCDTRLQTGWSVLGSRCRRRPGTVDESWPYSQRTHDRAGRYRATHDTRSTSRQSDARPFDRVPRRDRRGQGGGNHHRGRPAGAGGPWPRPRGRGEQALDAEAPRAASPCTPGCDRSVVSLSEPCNAECRIQNADTASVEFRQSGIRRSVFCLHSVSILNSAF